MSEAVKELRPIPLKKIEYCPKPTLLHASDDYYYIIFVTDFFSDRKCLSYDIERKSYFEICDYPDVRLIDPIYSASPSGKLLYIFDGLHQSFAMLEIEIDRNDACYHPKVVNIRKTKRKTERLRNLIKTGKRCLSIYLPQPWNEYHIIGGETNSKHCKWCIKKKQFINVSDTNSIIDSNKHKHKGITATNIFFSKKYKQFILLGESGDIWNLSYPSPNNSHIYAWIKTLIKLPYKNMQQFGSAMYNEQYIIIFGGIAAKNSFKLEKLNDIFILDIERNEWRKSQILCPIHANYHAIYVSKFKKIHLFGKERDNNGQFRHWVIDLHLILKNAKLFKCNYTNNVSDIGYTGIKNDNNVDADSHINAEVEIRNAEEMDYTSNSLYKEIDKTKIMQNNEKIKQIEKNVVEMKEEISLIWDFVTKLKNDMQTIKEYQIEIIKNSQSNTESIINLHGNIKDVKEIQQQQQHKKKKKKQKKHKSYQNYQNYQNYENDLYPNNPITQHIVKQQVKESVKDNYGIFDSDENENENENINENINKNENINENTKNLALVDEVEYDSIEMRDDEQFEDEKLKTKIKNQMKKQNNNKKKNMNNNKKKNMNNNTGKLKEWLDRNRLSEYYTIFIDKGFHSLDELIALDDSAFLTQIGVTKLVHRRKFIAKLKIYAQSKK